MNEEQRSPQVDSEDSEFEEVAHSGGFIELKLGPTGYGVRLEHFYPWAFAFFQIAMRPNKTPAAIIPMTGMGAMPVTPPADSALSFVISDREGMFGRSCPACGSYFRSTWVWGTHCPYCGHVADGTHFLTKNQIAFANGLLTEFSSAAAKQAGVRVNLDKAIDGLTDNRPSWKYDEERQQRKFTCSHCDAVFDVLGDYVGCPSCEKRTGLQVYMAKLTATTQDLDTADSTIGDRQERARRWKDLLRRAASDFDAFFDDIKTRLSRLPLTPKRRNAVLQLSPMRLSGSAKSLSGWFDFALLAKVDDVDVVFLNRMFNRRHLVTHKSGRVDQEYLDNTGDTSVKLNAAIRVQSAELRRLLGLLRTVAENASRDLEVLCPPRPLK